MATPRERGQTSVEYVLLLSVVSLVAATAFKSIREGLMGDGSCRGNPKPFLCRIVDAIEGGGLGGGGPCGTPFRCHRIR